MTPSNGFLAAKHYILYWKLTPEEPGPILAAVDDPIRTRLGRLVQTLNGMLERLAATNPIKEREAAESLGAGPFRIAVCPPLKALHWTTREATAKSSSALRR